MREVAPFSNRYLEFENLIFLQRNTFIEDEQFHNGQHQSYHTQTHTHKHISLCFYFYIIIVLAGGFHKSPHMQTHCFARIWHAKE